LLIAFAAGPAWAQGARCGSRGQFTNLEAVGLTGNQRLVCFLERQPAQARDIGPVTGLMGGETLVGIDFRPSSGMLFGLGNQGGIYIIDPSNGTARRQATLSMMGNTGMPVMLQGTSFGVDFNPVPDRLRVTSDAGQSLRVNVDTGETNVDGVLNPPAAPDAARGVTAVAYTNNDKNPMTATVLFDIDTMADQLSIQAPPNAGTLNPVGALGMDAGVDTSFDIFTSAQPGEGVRGLATFMMGGQTRLFRVDLTTGQLTLAGSFAANTQIMGIAIPLMQRN
jgi:hypothetical protein